MLARNQMLFVYFVYFEDTNHGIINKKWLKKAAKAIGGGKMKEIFSQRSGEQTADEPRLRRALGCGLAAAAA